MGKKVYTETRYFVLLPTVEAHVNSHPTSGAAGFAQRVHPKISEKVNTLVGEGITDVQEVKRALIDTISYMFCSLTQQSSQ